MIGNFENIQHLYVVASFFKYLELLQTSKMET